MKNIIALAQVNLICADIEHNKNKIIDFVKKAKEKNASLVIFPELTLTPQPLGDILLRYPLVCEKCQKALFEIQEFCQDISALVGFIEENKENGKFYNSIALIQNKKIIKTAKKTVISKITPNDEHKYFDKFSENFENRIFEIQGINYGLFINEEELNNKALIEQIKTKADYVICCSTSCTRYKKDKIKHKFLSDFSKNNNLKLIYVNQVGGYDEFIYDGTSRIYNNQGEIEKISKAFEEDCFIVDLNSKETIAIADYIKSIEIKENFSLDYDDDLERTYNSLVLAIKDYFNKNGFKQAVLGLSGGLDSTICAVLLTDALGCENVLGISMPSKLTSSESKNDALELAQNLGINFLEVPIKDAQDSIGEKFNKTFNEIEKSWTNKSKISYTQDNIQARFRSMVLWGVANEFNSTLSIATSDKSELYMGYATINGDMSGGYAPISDVVKTKLFALAKWMNKNREQKNAIPESIILKPPGAELALDPKTGKTLLAEDALMPYEFLDEVIWRIENFNQSVDDMMKIEFLYEKKNNITKATKTQWLEKFFRRTNTALYKWCIAPVGAIVDTYSINKAEYKQPISSNINYK